MIPIVLGVGLGLLAVGGLAWTIAPLTGRRETIPAVAYDDEAVAVGRLLEELDDLESERDRGALTAQEYAAVEAELRRDAARQIKAREARLRRIDGLIDAWLERPAGRAGAQPAPALDTARPVRRRRTVAWLGATVASVGLLIGLIAAVTIGARGALGSQTVVGQVNVTGIAGLAVFGTDPGQLLVGHPAGLQQSRDGGASWQVVDFPRPVRGIAAAGGRLFTLGDDGLYVSEAGTDGWTRLAGAPTLSVLGVGGSSGRLIAIDESGRPLESADGGQTWARLSLAPLADVTSVAVVDAPTRMVLAGTRGEGLLAGGPDGTWRSANGFVNGALPTVNIRAVYYDGNSGDSYASPSGAPFQGAIYVATDANLFKSVDGGQSWSALGLAADVVAIGGRPEAPQEIFALARDGSVYRSLDGGASWE